MWPFKKKKPEPRQLTDRGIYFCKYLTKIIDGSWTEKDFNQYYEDDLEEFRALNHLDRETAAYYYYQFILQTLEG